MCGRYQFSSAESREMQKILRDAERRSRGRFPVELNFPMAGDVAPTQVAPVLIASGDKVVAGIPTVGHPGLARRTDDQRPRRDGLRQADVPPQHGRPAVRDPGQRLL